MTSVLAAPVASESYEAHADWLELLALSKDDQNSSSEDLIRELRRSGSIEAVGEPEAIARITDQGSETSQAVAGDSFSELQDRSAACGGHSTGYPFDVYARYIQARDGCEKSIYTFLLLLSYFGKDAGPSTINAADVFERVSAIAAVEYFGGADGGARSYLFGFPRRLAPAGFRDALDDLCLQMGEGVGCRNHPTRRDQKDAKLDLAVWRTFQDGRPGKLIGFGQCATGNNWPGKISEMQPPQFCQKWMYKMPTVQPVRLFFVPFRIESKKWDHVCIDGGILFDRCRIAQLARGANGDLLDDCTKWSQQVLGELR